MDSPVSNEVYDLLSVLDAKLEGLSAYDKYDQDLHGETRQLLAQIRSDDKRHAEMLVNAVEQIARNGGLTKR
jgi:hypothetical protein